MDETCTYGEERVLSKSERISGNEKKKIKYILNKYRVYHSLPNPAFL